MALLLFHSAGLYHANSEFWKQLRRLTSRTRIIFLLNHHFFFFFLPILIRVLHTAVIEIICVHESYSHFALIDLTKAKKTPIMNAESSPQIQQQAFKDNNIISNGCSRSPGSSLTEERIGMSGGTIAECVTRLSQRFSFFFFFRFHSAHSHNKRERVM